MALHRTEIDLAPAPPTRARTRRGALARGVDLPALPWLIALSIAAVYLVVFVVELPHTIEQLSWNASVASGYVMPETIVKTGTGGFTVMGSTGQWVSLWFGLLTAGLPLHRQLWGVAPTLLFALTALIVGWSVLRVANRRAAVLAVLIGLVASPLSLAFYMSPFSHNTVYPCTALCGAYLVWLAHGHARRRFTAFAVPPLLGVVIGACMASDLLLASTAVIPLALTGTLAGLRRDRRSRLVSLSAWTTAVAAIPSAKLTSTTMGSLGYKTLPTPVKLASLSELPSRAKLLFEGLKALFNGYLGGPEGPGTLHAPLGLASDVVMCAALATLIVIGVRATVRFIVSGVRRREATLTPAELGRSLHVVYWFTAAATACGAFWIAGEGPVTTHYSYYATVVFAVAAVIPLLLSSPSPARWLIAIGASVFFTAGLVGLTSDYLNIAAPIARSAPLVRRIAQANDVQVGYSNWADAAGLTWGTHNRVVVRPVVECATREGTTLCPGFQAYVPSWYVPRQRRTFLLVEANGVDLAGVPAFLGRPVAAYAFESMRMYIYPYDIASRFGS